MRRRKLTIPPENQELAIDTDIHLAISDRNINLLVKAIKEHKDQINTQNAMKSTPLDLAISLANLEAIEILIENGADLNIHNREGLTPMHQLIKNVDYFLENNISHDAIINTAKKLILKGALLTIQDRRGNTLINYVAQKAKANKSTTKTFTKLGKLLLSYDKDVTNTVQIKNNMGKTPQDYLSRNGNLLLREDVYMCGLAKHTEERISSIIAETESILKRNSLLEKIEA